MRINCAMHITQEERLLFPIVDLKSFLELIQKHITIHECSGPNLAYLSILFGYLEQELTTNRVVPPNSSIPHQINEDLSSVHDKQEGFPTLHLEIVEGLLELFTLTLKAHVDRSLSDLTTRGGNSTKKLCKLVSDVLWSGLLKSYHKDKAHIQSLFSYLTSKIIIK